MKRRRSAADRRTRSLPGVAGLVPRMPSATAAFSETCRVWRASARMREVSGWPSGRNFACRPRSVENRTLSPGTSRAGVRRGKTLNGLSLLVGRTGSQAPGRPAATDDCSDLKAFPGLAKRQCSSLVQASPSRAEVASSGGSCHWGSATLSAV